MPRTYKKVVGKTRRYNYTEKSLEKAVNDVYNAKGTLRKAEELYGVSRNTISAHVRIKRAGKEIFYFKNLHRGCEVHSRLETSQGEIQAESTGEYRRSRHEVLADCSWSPWAVNPRMPHFPKISGLPHWGNGYPTPIFYYNFQKTQPISTYFF